MKENEPSMMLNMLELPLLKGVGRVRMQEIVGKFPMHFLRYEAGEEIVAAARECSHLKFVLSGSVQMSMTDPTECFEVEERLDAPQVIAPDSLFGRDTTYPAAVRAVDSVSIMQISKEDYRAMLALDPVFLFNYLNYVCSSAQRGQNGLLALAAGSATERIAYWVITLTQPGARDIHIGSCRADLHTVMGIGAQQWRSATERLLAANILTEVTPRSISISSRAALATLLDCTHSNVTGGASQG